jgi:hypothetical protein
MVISDLFVLVKTIVVEYISAAFGSVLTFFVIINPVQLSDSPEGTTFWRHCIVEHKSPESLTIRF